MKIKGESILSIGMMSMAVGVLVDRFLPYEYFIFKIFVEGILIGLSLTLNSISIRRRQQR